MLWQDIVIEHVRSLVDMGNCFCAMYLGTMKVDNDNDDNDRMAINATCQTWQSWSLYVIHTYVL